MTDTFYFVVSDDVPSQVKVIDLQCNTSYKRDDFNPVDDRDFNDLNEAIRYAKKIAEINNVRYVPFESRYDRSLNECKLKLPTEW